MIEPRDIERFWRKVVVDCACDCWIWVGNRLSGPGGIGYGRLKVRGVNEYAHRLAYAAWRGPIGDGLDLDHLCRVRACVNPWHLEPVTRRVNVLRGAAPAARWATRTHCDRGHPFAGENLSQNTANGSRRCRICSKANAKAWREGRRVPWTTPEPSEATAERAT